MLAILAASYAFPVRAWLDQREQLSDLGAQRDALAAEVEALEQSRDLWNDPAYVRGQARERLNYVLPGEVGLVVLGTESTTPDEPVTGTLVPASESDQPWWSTLVTAFSEVGAGDPTQVATEQADSSDASDGGPGTTAQEPGSDAVDAP